MKIIITGTTGMVGEGILLECLQNSKVTEVLGISRKSCGIKNPKFKEILVADFTKIDEYKDELNGHDACFFCSGVSSVGMSEEKYTYITYDTTLAFAKTLVNANSDMTFIYVSGGSTDSTENGKVMWARVKGRTENHLLKLPFKRVVNFRPGAMLPFKNQQHIKGFYAFIGKTLSILVPKYVIPLSELGKAMIHAVERDKVKPILEVKDIKELAK